MDNGMGMPFSSRMGQNTRLYDAARVPVKTGALDPWPAPPSPLSSRGKGPGV